LAEKIVTDFGATVTVKFGKSALRAKKISPARGGKPALLDRKFSPDFSRNLP
jgi:hypothetical protein